VGGRGCSGGGSPDQETQGNENHHAAADDDLRLQVKRAQMGRDGATECRLRKKQVHKEFSPSRIGT